MCLIGGSNLILVWLGSEEHHIILFWTCLCWVVSKVRGVLSFCSSLKAHEAEWALMFKGDNFAAGEVGSNSGVHLKREPFFFLINKKQVL